MPLPLTSEDRGTSSLSRGVEKKTEAERGTESRNAGSAQPMQQEQPYASHAGPLMKMSAALERAKKIEAAKKRESELDRLEHELRVREALIPSLVAGAKARSIHSEHQEKVKGGNGIGFGNVWLDGEAEKLAKKHAGSNWKDKFQYYREQKKKELEKQGLAEVSCLTMMEETLPSYVDTQGKLLPGKKEEEVKQALMRAEEKAKDADYRATVLLEELRTQFGFETVHIDSVPGENYWNLIKDKKVQNYSSDKDVRKTGSVPIYAEAVKGIQSKQDIDVHVKVDRFVKLEKKMTAESRDLWDALKRVDYAVGVTDSGYHTYVVSAGMVYEIHWDRGPTDPTLTAGRPLEEFFRGGGRDTRWGSGVIAVPPSILQPK